MGKGKKIFITMSSIIIIALLVISTLFFAYDAYLFTGILKFYRIMGSILIIYIGFLLLQGLFSALRKKKFNKYTIFLIIGLIYACGLLFADYYVYKIVSNLNFEESTTYSVTLITFNKDIKKMDDVDGLNIGIIKDKSDVANCILGKELIKENDLDKYNEIIEYDSVPELLNAIYKDEVNAIFINSEYKTLYGNLEEYSDIADKAIEIKTLKKDVKDIDISITTQDSSNKSLTDPFTVLVLGVDSESDGLNPNAAFNGDTMIMISFNPNTMQATMFSIPRDTYVPISCSGGRLNKVNSSAYGGASCVVRTLENLTDITIDYYVMINFKGVVDLVNSLGNITVDVPMEFCEQDSNRAFGDNTICLKTGTQTLNGEQALALARHRKTLPLGDFQRGQNQQLVIEGMLGALKNMKSINQVVNILDIINKNMSTNLSREQILSLYEVGKNMILGNNTNVLNIQKTFLTGYDMYVNEGGSERYAFFHYKKSLASITNAMRQTLGTAETTPIKTFSFSINETYEREIIGYEYYSEARYDTVPNFSSMNIISAMSWANSRGIPITVLDNTTTAPVTKDYDDYSIVDQSEYVNTLVVRVSEITIYVANKYGNTTNEDDDNDEGDTSTSSSQTSSSSTSSSSSSSEEEPSEPSSSEDEVSSQE